MENEPSPHVHDESGISPQERVDLLAQIEDVVARARVPVTQETLAYTPRRSGILFPIILNVAAVALIASAALLFWLFSARQERAITSGSGTTLSGEKTLVSTLRREAEDKLKAKDGEIGQIQGVLDQTTRRLDILKQDADAQVQAKERELRASLDAQLATEKARLEKEGSAAAATNRQLASLRDQLQAASTSKLDAFRDQVNADLTQKQTALDAQFSVSQKALAQAQEEKTQLEAQVQAQAQAAGRSAASAAGEQARLAQQVEALSAQDQRQQLVLDQVAASYVAVGDALGASRWDEARGTLATLASSLDQDSVSSLPAVQRRKSADAFLISALQRLIEYQRAAAAPAPAATATPAPAAAATAAVSDTAARDARAAQDKIAALLKQIDDAARKVHAQKTATADRLAVLTAGLAAASRDANTAANASQAELITLLDSKVKVKAVLETQAVRDQYPGLGPALDRYLQLFGDEKRQEGRVTALQDAATVLDYLLGAKGRDALAPLWSRYGDEVERAAFQQLIGRLRTLTP